MYIDDIIEFELCLSEKHTPPPSQSHNFHRMQHHEHSPQHT